jgi:phage portal protein BeeE
MFASLAPERKMTSLELFREIYGTRLSSSGKNINWNTAVQVATVMACARIIGDGLAQIPLKLFKESPDGSRLPASDHPLYRMLHRRPNQWQTSFEFRQMLGLHLTLTGNAYCYVEPPGRSHPRAHSARAGNGAIAALAGLVAAYVVSNFYGRA